MRRRRPVPGGTDDPVVGERGAAGWGEELVDLVARHSAGGAGVERRPVKVMWWTVATGPRADVVGTVARLWSGRRTRLAEGRTRVGVFAPGAAVGDLPDVVLEVADDCFVERRGRATATAFGRAEPGGAVLVETRRATGVTVVPLAPPEAPDDDTPRWSEVDAPG